MNDDDVEPRLRAMLGARAEQVDSDLAGPELRRRAGDGRSASVRRVLPVLAAVAAVAVIGVGAALFTDNSTPSPVPSPVQPGGVTVTAPTSTPTSTPTRPPTRPATATPSPFPSVGTLSAVVPVPPASATAATPSTVLLPSPTRSR